MIKIAPSILAADFSRLGEEIVRLEAAGADIIHLDIMDGHFVPNITIGPSVIKALRPLTKLPFDVHLMIDNPDRYIDDFIDAGADILTVHVEACPHLHRTIQKIHQRGIKAAVALNPATSLSTIEWILKDLDMVLIMTVNPGFGGQSFIEPMIQKVKELRKLADSAGKDLNIEVDGGIGPDNIGLITDAGANIIVAGSAVFKTGDVAGVIALLKENAAGASINTPGKDT